MKSLLTVVIVVTGLFSGAQVTIAADFLVAPLAVNLDLERRDIINDELTLINQTNRELRLYAGVNEVAVSGEGILESFTSPSMTDRTVNPTSWFQITRSRIEVPPGETVTVPYTIKLNPKTEPGSYSVFVGFATGSNQPQALQKIKQGAGEGSLFNISVEQKQNQFLRLEQYTVDRFVVSDSGTIEVELRNPGIGSVVPGGEVIFYNSRGAEVAAVPFNSDGQAIGEKAVETFSLSTPTELGLGKYKAYLSVEYGDVQRANVTDSTVFYVTPMTQLIILFLVLLTTAVVITLIVYRRYDVEDHNGTSPVAMFVRPGASEGTDHDIDLKQRRHDADN